MSNGNQVFLGKAGKIYGPYSQEEFNQMFAKGKVSDFNWIWDWKQQSWKPIELPPPSPLTLDELSHGSSKANTNSVSWTSLKAICFDHFSVASGVLECVTETGCLLKSGHSEGGSKFTLKSNISLNLYDQVSGKSITVKVNISDITFNQHCWNYRLKWNEVPALLNC
jgi:hypothetical protein